MAFPLHPETPLEGRTLDDLFTGRLVNIPQMLAKLKEVASSEGLPFGARSMTYNSRAAQEMAKWAGEQGRDEEFHRAAFAAYFAHGKNIAQPEVLRSLAETAGLDPEAAMAALESGAYAKAVDEDWAYARSLGVSAVPSFAAGGQMVVGAQPYSALKGLVEAAGARPLADI